MRNLENFTHFLINIVAINLLSINLKFLFDRHFNKSQRFKIKKIKKSFFYGLKGVFPLSIN